MDIYKSQGFFSANAKTKTSKAGKDYVSIGVAMSSKQQDSTYKKDWFNMIEPRDLLVLSNICKDLYSALEQAKSDERSGGKSSGGYEQKPDNGSWGQSSPDLVDEIPFAPHFE